MGLDDVFRWYFDILRQTPPGERPKYWVLGRLFTYSTEPPVIGVMIESSGDPGMAVDEDSEENVE